MVGLAHSESVRGSVPLWLAAPVPPRPSVMLADVKPVVSDRMSDPADVVNCSELLNVRALKLP